MLYANIRVTLSTSNLATTKICNARFWLGHLGFTIVPGTYHRQSIAHDTSLLLYVFSYLFNLAKLFRH